MKQIKQAIFPALAGALVLGASSPAIADEAGSAVSGSFGVDYASHFVSYGADVWGGGSDFYGSQSTTFVWFDIATSLPNGFSWNFGVWGDVNDNSDGPATVGGNIQEIDTYIGIGYGAGIASFGVTYQEWNYGGVTAERILDLSVGLDDSGVWGGGFALNPGLTVHMRIGSESGAEEGQVYVLSVGPGFDVGSVSFSVPVAVAMVSDDYYIQGEGGYAYSSAGLSASVPMTFVPEAYGSWSLGFGTTYYMTSEDVIGNPEDDFLTGMVSLGLSF